MDELYVLFMSCIVVSGEMYEKTAGVVLTGQIVQTLEVDVVT